MSSTIKTFSGDVCRPTTRTDIIIFILLTPVLHALTAPPSPGSGTASTLTSFLISLFSPYLAAMNAVHIIGRRLRRCRDDLERALRDQALCMLVPRHWEAGELVDPAISRVHGQLPGPDCNKYDLVLVPDWFTVEPYPRADGLGNVRIAQSTNALRVIAAIVQILYGTHVIYQANERPSSVVGGGWGTYAVAAVPYVLMSLLNLVALLCRPHYPSLYMVALRGEKERADLAADAEMEKQQPAEVDLKWTIDAEAMSKGQVGLSYSLPEDQRPAYVRDRRFCELATLTLQYAILAVFLIAPYTLLHAIHNFHQQATTSATVVALAVGQALSLGMVVIEGYLLPRPRLERPPVIFKFTSWHNLRWNRPAEIRVWWDNLLIGWPKLGLMGSLLVGLAVGVVLSVAVVWGRIVVRAMNLGEVCLTL